MRIFGDKNVFCFIIGEENEGGLQPVDIWASNTLLTPIDNMAYLPQFIASLEAEKNDIESGTINHDYMFFGHGSTTDDVTGTIMLVGKTAKLSFNIDGLTCLVSIAIPELLSIYKSAIEYLRSINA